MARLGLVMAVVVGLAGGGVLLARAGGEAAVPAFRAVGVEPAAAAEVAPLEALPVFAEADGVPVRLVSPDVVAVAFHEASYGDARELVPLGRCDVCRNRWKFTPPPPVAPDLSYIVTDTRGRSTPATSAADLILRRGEEVLSPVTGTVVEVRPYRLYGRYRDVRVEIRPDEGADRTVVLLHLDRVRLRPGDRVEASLTPLGIVRAFPFESQADRYVRGGHPHVHLEVKDPAAPRRSPKDA